MPRCRRLLRTTFLSLSASLSSLESLHESPPAGHTISHSQLDALACSVCDAAERLSPQKVDRWWCEPSLKFLPPDVAVEKALRRVKQDRALGNDGIRISVLTALGSTGVRLLGNLARAIIMTKRFPIAWHGGKLTKLFKRGSHLICDNFRGLLIGDHMSKVLTGLLKPPVQEIASRLSGEQQIAYQCGMDASMAALTTTSALAFAKVHHRSVAITFADESKAFDRAIREVALGFDRARFASQAELASHLSSLGMSEAVASRTADQLWSRGGQLQRGDMPTGLIDAIRELHTPSWFSVDRSDEVITTSKGSRQGCLLGGLLFILARVDYLSDLRSRLLADDLCIRFVKVPDGCVWANACSDPVAGPNLNGDGILQDICYSDDLALMVDGDDPWVLIDKQQRLLDTLSCCAADHGVTLNWGPTKTACIVALRGRGSRHARNQLRLDGDLFRLRDGGQCPIVRAYKHVGTTVCDNLSVADDSRRLSSAVACTIAALRPTLRVVSCESTRVRLVKSLAISRIAGIGCYSGVSIAAGRCLEIAQTRALRAAIRQPRYGGRLVDDDDTIRKRTGTSSISWKMSCARLKLAAKLTLSGPCFLTGLLASKPPLPWSLDLAADMRFCMESESFCGTPGSLDDRIAWTNFFGDKHFNKRVSSVAVFTSPWGAAKPPEVIRSSDIADAVTDGLWVCHICREDGLEVIPSFRSHRALVSHCTRSHDQQSAWYSYIDFDLDGSDTPVVSCRACKKSFRSPEVARDHLAHRAAKCRRRIADGTITPSALCADEI